MDLITKGLTNLYDQYIENPDANIDAYLLRVRQGPVDRVCTSYGRMVVEVSKESLKLFAEQKDQDPQLPGVARWFYDSISARKIEQVAFRLAMDGVPLDTVLGMHVEQDLCNTPIYESARLVDLYDKTVDFNVLTVRQPLWLWMAAAACTTSQELIKDCLDFVKATQQLMIQVDRKLAMVKSSSLSGYLNYEDVRSRYGLTNGDMNYNDEVLVWPWNIHASFGDNVREFVNRKVVL